MNVIVYSSKTCGPCLSLKKFLDHKGVNYEVRDIDASPTWANQVVKHTGQLIVPVTMINSKVIRGLNYTALSEALREAQ